MGNSINPETEKHLQDLEKQLEELKNQVSNSKIKKQESESKTKVQESESKTKVQESESKTKVQIIKPVSNSESESSSESESNNNSKNTLQIYNSSLLYINQECERRSRKRQLCTSLYETRRFKLFNKYEVDLRDILSVYEILDKYYNIDYKLLSDINKKQIYDDMLIFHTSPKYINEKIYINISNNNFQYLGYFYYYLGKSLKILNETVNNTSNLDEIEEAKNTFIENLHYLENTLEDQHNKKIWTRIAI